MKSVKSKLLVYAAWGLITILFATVVKFSTQISWPISLALAAMTGIFGCIISMMICRWTDRQGIRRLNLIIFGGVCLILTLVVPTARAGSFDPTGMKMFIFTAAGLVLTTFFLPLAEPKPAKAKTQGARP